MASLTLPTMGASRRILAVRISDDSREAIEAHCLEHGITVTAWLEAVGIRLADLRAGTIGPRGTFEETVQETVRVARSVDARRRSRPRA